MDPLMHLVADVESGFNQPMNFCTVLMKLDIKSAYDCVVGPKLIDIFCRLSIPPIYARFYKSFLEGREFRVRCGNHYSKWSPQQCGLPQGSPSSPILWIIYLEYALREILPYAEDAGMTLECYADDMFGTMVGTDIALLAKGLTDVLNDCMVPALAELNLRFDKKKGQSYLFTMHPTNKYSDKTQMIPDSWPCIFLGDHFLPPPLLSDKKPSMKGTRNDAVASLRLLGVFFDKQLRFNFHVKEIVKRVKSKSHLLQRMVNSYWGPDQQNMRTAYYCYVQSILLYCAPVWYPFLSKTSRHKLDVVQHETLRLGMGLYRGTRIDDLLKESNVRPLESVVRVDTAIVAEKYRRFPSDSPLFALAHSTLGPHRLKHHSWQYLSDEVLIEHGYNPSRNDAHGLSMYPYRDLIDLSLRVPFSFVSQLAPWENYDDYENHIMIVPTLAGLRKDTPNLKRKAEDAIRRYGNEYVKSLWTDGSYSPKNNFSAAACVGFPINESVIDPADDLTDDPPLPCSMDILSSETGRHACSFTPEVCGLNKAIDMIASDPPTYKRRRIQYGDPESCKRKRVWIGTDSQSSLMGFNPFKRPKFGKLDISYTIKRAYDVAREMDCELEYHWTPSHQRIFGQTQADQEANIARIASTLESQSCFETPPYTLKTQLKQKELKRWNKQICDHFLETSAHSGLRFIHSGQRPTNFKACRGVPRPLQCLFSRWHVGVIDICGRRPRYLGFTAEDSSVCRLCLCAKESVYHLLTACPGTRAYRSANNLSLYTLRGNSPCNILAIAKFDECLTCLLPFDTQPPLQTSLQASRKAYASRLASQRQDTSLPTQSTDEPYYTPPKRSRRRYFVCPTNWHN